MKNSLLEIVKLPMSDRQRRAIQRLDAEDCEVITYLTVRHHNKTGQSFPKEYYEAGCFALMQYYATSIFDRKNMHAISDSLDPFWHSHILDTVSYESLCNDIQGFMHHDPLNDTNKRKVEAVKEVYSYTNDVLARIFGASDLDRRFYPLNPTNSVIVCMHDVDERSFDDVFPVNPKIEKHRNVYGHEARQRVLKAAVDDLFQKEQAAIGRAIN